MVPLIELIPISYVAVHTVIFLITLFYSKSSLESLYQSVKSKQSLSLLVLLHFLDVGTDLGVMFGWWFETNTFRKSISNDGIIILVAFSFHALSKITSTVYMFYHTRRFAPTVLQFFDLGVYYQLFETDTSIIDLQTEQILRCFANIQCFPMAIIQTYLLVGYQLIGNQDHHSLDSSDYSHIICTLISLCCSMLFIMTLEIIHDAKYMNTRDTYMSCGMPKWLLRASFRCFELVSRVLWSTYIWILYGPIALAAMFVVEWLFQIYNQCGRKRYDDWNLLSISFWNFDWKLSASHGWTQRTCDPIDVVQCWSVATLFYGNKMMRTWQLNRNDCFRLEPDVLCKGNEVSDWSINIADICECPARLAML